MLIHVFPLDLQFIQPKLCSNATWNANATTFVTNILGLLLPLVINRHNTLIAANHDDRQIFIWFNSSSHLPRIINVTDRTPISLFPNSDDEILVGYEEPSYPYLDRWSLKNGTLLSSIFIYGQCYFFFIDMNNDLYCSVSSQHMVTRTSWQDRSNSFTIVAGTGSPGLSTITLNNSRGIFVTSNLDLYVADCNNDRVQFFRAGQTNATTVQWSGSNSTLILDSPVGVTLDADGYLYIVSLSHHRVIAVSPAGSGRCVIGCTGTFGSAANQISSPWTVAFDIEGNLFVGDNGNNRIQKFALIWNQCGK